MFESSHVTAHLTQLGGHLAPVAFRVGKKTVSPYSVAPWAEEKIEAGLPGLLHALRGDFFCAPFGGNGTPWRGEKHPPHGETANAAWELASFEKSGSTVTLHASLATKVRKGRVDKFLTLVDGHAARHAHAAAIAQVRKNAEARAPADEARELTAHRLRDRVHEVRPHRVAAVDEKVHDEHAVVRRSDAAYLDVAHTTAARPSLSLPPADAPKDGDECTYRHVATTSSKSVATTDRRWNATVASLAYASRDSVTMAGSTTAATCASIHSKYANKGG
jgi:hypothetical protein